MQTIEYGLDVVSDLHTPNFLQGFTRKTCKKQLIFIHQIVRLGLPTMPKVARGRFLKISMNNLTHKVSISILAKFKVYTMPFDPFKYFLAI